jgi:hypothetical protein
MRRETKLKIRPAAGPKPASELKRAASRANLEKAWEANRRHWEKTPARMAASLRTIKLAQEAIRGVPRKLSPAQLAAVRRNVAKARAAMARRGRTPEHLAKLRETIKLARAARTSASYSLHNQKILKHGFYVRSVREAMLAMGDDTGRFDQRIERLKRFFNSTAVNEERLLQILARQLWRHERLYYAQAEWENARLDQLLATPESGSGVDLSGDDLTFRASGLCDVLLDNQRFYQLDMHLYGSVKRLLRRLLRQRLGREPKF